MALGATEAYAAQEGLDRDARDFWSDLEEWIAGQRLHR